MKQPEYENHTPESGEPRDIFRHYLGDIVYGSLDGIITTFAVVSGVTGASLAPTIVVVLGVANLVADGFSMAASNFLSTRSEAQAHDAERGYVEPFYHASFTFVSFVLVGAVPLISYLLVFPVSLSPFVLSCILTGITLFVVGAMRSFVTEKGWLQSGLEMLIIGAVAAVVAYGIGNFLKGYAG